MHHSSPKKEQLRQPGWNSPRDIKQPLREKDAIYIATISDECAKRVFELSAQPVYPGVVSNGREYLKVAQETLGSKTIFDVLELLFGFQHDNVKCQYDNAVGILGSRFSRIPESSTSGIPAQQQIVEKLKEYRDELLNNYSTWCEYMSLHPVKFAESHDLDVTIAVPFGGDEDGIAAALEIALFLCIWGESSNLRFCPEFLAWLYHKAASELTRHIKNGIIKDPILDSFLEQVIRPAYHFLADQLKDIGHGPINHAKSKQYDDFNEIFWHGRCLSWEIKTAFNDANMKLFQKTFVERQSWLIVLFAFWRVYTFHFVTLHILISIARWDLGIPGAGSMSDICTSVFTLYVSQVVRELYYMVMNITMALKHASGWFDAFSGFVRICWRCGIIICLSIFYMGGGRIFWEFSLLAFALALWEEVFFRMFPFVYKFNPSRAQLSFHGGKHSGRAWTAFFMSLFSDFTSLSVYTTGVLKNPPDLSKRVAYTFFWILVLTSKFLFSYFAVIRKLYAASYAIYNYNVGSKIEVLFTTIEDIHNIRLIVALWGGSIAVYFIDTHIWYILWANIFAMFGGLWRRVGEVSTRGKVVLAFSRGHKRMLHYLSTSKLDKHVKFAHIWNEIIHSMREEDILNDSEAESLIYYIITLGPPVTFDDQSERSRSNYYRDIPCLPCFLFAGTIGRLIKDIKIFIAENSDYLAELIQTEEAVFSIQHEIHFVEEGNQAKIAAMQQRSEYNKRKFAALRMKLARKQASWVSDKFDDDFTIECAQQIFLATFLLFDGLLRDANVSKSFGVAYRKFFGIPNIERGYTVDPDERLSKVFTSGFFGYADQKTLLYNLHQIPEAFDKLALLADALSKSDIEVSKIQELYGSARIALIKVLDCDSESSVTTESETLAKNLLNSIRVALKNVTEISSEGAVFISKKYSPLLQRFARILKEPASALPGFVSNSEATRRIEFFINTLFMEKPAPQKTGHMPSWSTLTPYYNEEVILPISELRTQTQDGVTTLEYLMTIFPLEWNNFVERISREYGVGNEVVSHLKNLIYSNDSSVEHDEELNRITSALKRDRDTAKIRWKVLAANVDRIAEEQEKAKEKKAAEKILQELQEQVQYWASYRSQTLVRTVRGMMYHARAIRLLSIVEKDGPDGIGARSQRSSTVQFNIAAYYPRVDPKSERWKRTAILSTMKYRYVVSCQIYGSMAAGTAGNTVKQRQRNKQKATDIEKLAKEYPDLRIAFVDSAKGRYYSVLSKWGVDPQTNEEGMNEEYRIELPGNILVGEGKPNNQNHAIIFTSGEAVQTIDMNQDGYLEEALKQREMLEEFKFGEREESLLGQKTVQAPNLGRIVGFREHIFTQDVCSIANFFSLQEIGFVTATQRVFDDPLSVRFHYGHPDVFDRTSAITWGGVSRPSKGIHLSEDIFAGFYWVLRGGRSSQLDYIQAGKGRDVGVSQITGFTAKISMGNGMQARSREVTRLAQQFDICRLLSFYFSSVGGFITQCLLILSVFLIMYSKIFISFDSLSLELIENDVQEVYSALSSQYLFQLGFLIIVPIPMVVGVEHGIAVAASTLLNVLVRFSPFFFVFGAGTNSYYVNAAITQGTAHYKATGRGFVIEHENFLQGFKTYLHSHYLLALELFILLIVYAKFTIISNYFLETLSVYLLVVGWLYSPIMFNPNGLDNQAVISDFKQWITWLFSAVEDEEKAWLAWYSKTTNAVYENCQFRKKVEVTIMNLRYILLAWCFVKTLEDDRIKRNKSFAGSDLFTVSLFVAVLVFFIAVLPFNAENIRKHKSYKFSGRIRFQRILSLLCGLAVVIAIAVLSATGVATVLEMIYTLIAVACILYFMVLTILLFVSDALRRISAVQNTVRFIHLAVGLLIQTPVLLLSLLPFMADIQTRMNFNTSFSSRFTVAKIFAQEGRRKELTNKSD